MISRIRDRIDWPWVGALALYVVVACVAAYQVDKANGREERALQSRDRAFSMAWDAMQARYANE